MNKNTITYDPVREEEARNSWYLGTRDNFVFKIMNKFTNLNLSNKILDAGCGTGGVISRINKDEKLIIGSDTSLESLVWGRKRDRIINGVQASITSLPFRDETFDITLSNEVLEHVEDDLAALKELCRVTKHRIIITVPAHRYLWTDSDDILLHKRRYSKSQLVTLIKKSGMHIVTLKTFGIVPLLLVIMYKFFFGTKSKYKKTNNKEVLPLASRFKIPRPIEVTLRGLFLFDLWLSSKGLLFWGHSWWACIERANDSS